MNAGKQEVLTRLSRLPRHSGAKMGITVTQRCKVLERGMNVAFGLWPNFVELQARRYNGFVGAVSSHVVAG
jgi:hypothetical protein